MVTETLTRSYKYALHPAPVQVEAMNQAERVYPRSAEQRATRSTCSRAFSGET